MLTMTRITVSLKMDEREALQMLAERELRDLRSQAALIIRQDLVRRGLLHPIEPQSVIKSFQEPQGAQNGS